MLICYFSLHGFTLCGIALNYDLKFYSCLLKHFVKTIPASCSLCAWLLASYPNELQCQVKTRPHDVLQGGDLKDIHLYSLRHIDNTVILVLLGR